MCFSKALHRSHLRIRACYHAFLLYSNELQQGFGEIWDAFRFLFPPLVNIRDRMPLLFGNHLAKLAHFPLVETHVFLVLLGPPQVSEIRI